VSSWTITDTAADIPVVALALGSCDLLSRARLGHAADSVPARRQAFLTVLSSPSSLVVAASPSAGTAAPSAVLSSPAGAEAVRSWGGPPIGTPKSRSCAHRAPPYLSQATQVVMVVNDVLHVCERG
jgi:hypothetical protein